MVLLIYPPAAKPCEPPAGLARLNAALRSHGVPSFMLDANLEGQLAMLREPLEAADTWTARALKNREESLALLRQPEGYLNADRYKRAVSDLNRILTRVSAPSSVRVSLANYQDERLSPLRSIDLLEAAQEPERNPFYFYFAPRLESLLDDLRPDLAGLSINFLSQALTAFAMIGYLKRLRPGLRIIVGGGLVTSWVKTSGWKAGFSALIDEIAVGPGEEKLLSCLGIKAQGEHYPPDYSGLQDLPYLAPGFILPYSASTGCYWQRCSFCPELAEGNPYHPVPKSTVAEQLAALVESTKPHLIHLLDNALSPALLRELAVKPPGAPWYGFARADEQLADPDFCRALRQSGCVMLKLGLESGDQAVLDALRKGIDLGRVSRILAALKDAGIATYVYLLFGTPAEDKAQARRTLEFTVRHANEIGFLNLAIFNLPVYGPDAADVPTDAFYEGDLSLYRQFKHPLGWGRHEVRQFLDKEFRRHPDVADIIRRDPPVFTSNHAPLMVMASRNLR